MSACKYVTGPHSPFVEQLNALAAHANSVLAATTQTGQRKWAVPDVFEGWDGNVFNIAGVTSITNAYNRTDLNNRYYQALAHGADTTELTYGKVGETMCAKHQIDDLACQERAFRARCASPIRCMMHSANKRNGHGAARGVFDRRVQICREMIAAASIDNIGDQQILTDPPITSVPDLSTDVPESVL